MCVLNFDINIWQHACRCAFYDGNNSKLNCPRAILARAVHSCSNLFADSLAGHSHTLIFVPAMPTELKCYGASFYDPVRAYPVRSEFLNLAAVFRGDILVCPQCRQGAWNFKAPGVSLICPRCQYIMKFVPITIHTAGRTLRGADTALVEWKQELVGCRQLQRQLEK